MINISISNISLFARLKPPHPNTCSPFAACQFDLWHLKETLGRFHLLDSSQSVPVHQSDVLWSSLDSELVCGNKSIIFFLSFPQIKRSVKPHFPPPLLLLFLLLITLSHPFSLCLFLHSSQHHHFVSSLHSWADGHGHEWDYEGGLSCGFGECVCVGGVSGIAILVGTMWKYRCYGDIFQVQT